MLELARYFALTNNVTHVSACPSARNVLTLVTSPDLRRWTIRETLLETDEGMAQEDVWRYTSFSYVDWQFDGPNVRLRAQIHFFVHRCNFLERSADSRSPMACVVSQIIYAIRTSYRGGVSFHNTNRITFKTLKDFVRFL